jgi:hypothetical protein
MLGVLFAFRGWFARLQYLVTPACVGILLVGLIFAALLAIGPLDPKREALSVIPFPANHRRTVAISVGGGGERGMCEKQTAQAVEQSKGGKVVIAWLGGVTPVQGFGGIDGKEFYFRARGSYWSLSIGKEPIAAPEWKYEELYRVDERFQAGYMPVDEAGRFLRTAADRYLRGEPSVILPD